MSNHFLSRCSSYEIFIWVVLHVMLYYPKKNERKDQSLRIQILTLLFFYTRCSWKGQVKRNQRRMSICIVCLDCFTINYGEHGFDSFLKGITYFHIIWIFMFVLAFVFIGICARVFVCMVLLSTNKSEQDIQS